MVAASKSAQSREIMFQSFPHSDLKVVAKDGRLRWEGKGLFSSGKGRYPEDSVTIPDTAADVEPGDTIRRAIPNGREEMYSVERVNYHERFHGIPDHFVVKLHREGIEAAKPRATYVQVTGANARVNIGSHDQSTNYYGTSEAVFTELRTAIKAGIESQEHREKAIEALSRMEASKGQSSYLADYQAFIGTTADHITIIAPFIPALTTWLGG